MKYIWHFIRTFGCPVQCNWCDIPESWNGKEKPFTVTPEKLSKEILENKLADNVVITGGEPTIQKDLVDLVKIVKQGGMGGIEIETSGINYNSELQQYVRFNVSPKLYSAEAKINLNEEALRQYNKFLENDFKFVIKNLGDFKMALSLKKKLKLRNVYFMAEGVTSNIQIKRLRVIENMLTESGQYDIKLTPRLHVMMYDNNRKR